MNKVALNELWGKFDAPPVYSPMVYQFRPYVKKDAAVKRYVYLVREEWQGWIKIGMTENLTQRLHGLKGGLPQPITLVGQLYGLHAVRIEREIHTLFASKRGPREWFNLTDDDIYLLQATYREFEMFNEERK